LPWTHGHDFLLPDNAELLDALPSALADDAEGLLPGLTYCHRGDEATAGAADDRNTHLVDADHTASLQSHFH
jgi:hypothetical protein